MVHAACFLVFFYLLQTATARTGWNHVAKSAGKAYFGTATDNPELTDAAYVAILNDTSMFGQLTPGNSMKWDAIEPEEGQFDFSGGDEIVALAEATGKILRGHNLVWFSQLPAWVEYGSWSKDTLTNVLLNHIKTEVAHYEGKIHAWDVVNEPFNEDGSFRSNVFYDVLGSDYIATALRAARAADSNVKLYINDYGFEFSGAKIDAIVSLVQQLKADGVPIDGVGFESHLIVGQVDASILKANMERLTALDVEVAVTELDVRMPLPATPALLKQQSSDFEAVIATCMTVVGCVGVTLWDFTDRYSWVPAAFSGYGEACPWDSNLNRKPAFHGISVALAS